MRSMLMKALAVLSVTGIAGIAKESTAAVANCTHIVYEGAATEYGEGPLLLADLANPTAAKQIGTYTQDDRRVTPQLSPNCRYFVHGTTPQENDSFGLELIDLEGTVEPRHLNYVDFWFSPDSKYLFLSSHYDDAGAVIDLATGESTEMAGLTNIWFQEGSRFAVIKTSADSGENFSSYHFETHAMKPLLDAETGDVTNHVLGIVPKGRAAIFVFVAEDYNAGTTKLVALDSETGAVQEIFSRGRIDYSDKIKIFDFDHIFVTSTDADDHAATYLVSLTHPNQEQLIAECNYLPSGLIFSPIASRLVWQCDSDVYSWAPGDAGPLAVGTGDLLTTSLSADGQSVALTAENSEGVVEAYSVSLIGGEHKPVGRWDGVYSYSNPLALGHDKVLSSRETSDYDHYELTMFDVKGGVEPVILTSQLTDPDRVWATAGGNTILWTLESFDEGHKYKVTGYAYHVDSGKTDVIFETLSEYAPNRGQTAIVTGPTERSSNDRR